MKTLTLLSPGRNGSTGYYDSSPVRWVKVATGERFDRNQQSSLCMARTRYRFGDENYPHFMTQTIVAWLPVFSQPIRLISCGGRAAIHK